VYARERAARPALPDRSAYGLHDDGVPHVIISIEFEI
jgi:hypothetical protein